MRVSAKLFGRRRKVSKHFNVKPSLRCFQRNHGGRFTSLLVNVGCEVKEGATGEKRAMLQNLPDGPLQQRTASNCSGTTMGGFDTLQTRLLQIAISFFCHYHPAQNCLGFWIGLT